MYVSESQWSQPDDGDPGPCFRQGDLVELSWVRPELISSPDGSSLTLAKLTVRTEIVALMSYCCDLVARQPPKRKAFLFVPLADLPRIYVKDPALMAGLKATAREAIERGLQIPMNLFYFEPYDGGRGCVAHLETMQPQEMSLLTRAKKRAELRQDARFELRERVKAHFARDGK